MSKLDRQKKGEGRRKKSLKFVIKKTLFRYTFRVELVVCEALAKKEIKIEARQKTKNVKKMKNNIKKENT